ncbi:MAG: VOC family protein, partial [Acidobacteriota bacterium]
MKSVSPYLNFDGNCREAMTFYASCLGAELEMMPFSQMPGGAAPGTEDRLMHSRLSKGSVTIMASDTMPGTTSQQGNNFYLCVSP